MEFMTDFADEAVILPLSLCVTILFYVMGWQRGWRIWCTGVVAILGCLVLIKILGLYWGQFFGFTQRPFSISGHVTASTAVYGALLTLVLHSRQTQWQWGRALLPPLLIAAVIGYTRLRLHAHTQAEVLWGTLLGTVGALWLARSLLPMPAKATRYVMLVPACVALLFHGYIFRGEFLLQSLFYNSYHWARHALIW